MCEDDNMGLASMVAVHLLSMFEDDNIRQARNISYPCLKMTIFARLEWFRYTVVIHV